MSYPQTVRWTAALAIVAGWLVLSAPLRAQLLKADYQFQGDYSNSAATGVAALTALGTGNTFITATVNGTSQQVLNVPNASSTASAQNGVQTPANPFADQGDYSIVLLASFTAAAGNPVSKVFDFKSFTSDAGLYIDTTTGLFQFADNSGLTVLGGTSTAGVLTAGTYFQLTLTRSSSTNVLTAYQNGTQAFQFTDTTNLATLNTMLGLFRDDGVGTASGTTNEGTPGTIARLRLYDGVLTQAQVAALAVPEPSTWATLIGGGLTLTVAALRRRRAAR